MRTSTDATSFESPVKTAVLIAGPTASGKSALALALARQRGGLIINTDALQVYRELAILSARPNDDEMMMAPHSLYGHVSGLAPYSVASWLKDARRRWKRRSRRSSPPSSSAAPGCISRRCSKASPKCRRYRTRCATSGAISRATCITSWRSETRSSAKRLNANDRQRLSRALEVIEATGHPLQHWQDKAAGKAALIGYEVERYLVDVPREELYERAEARFDQMIAAGAVDEVRPLLRLDPELPMMKAIGVPELCAYLRGECTLEKAVADAKTATRNYIKRQFTWWRGQLPEWQDRIF